ncbi:hypothetical protein [Glycomyces arizonensis]|uniref:hypothetical protein n=1 Tax=Glycomyces arizonensis TaxID=256035 RepID=UPI0004789D0D|nr:hypothetical protein [Glycomyces arizonensis]
MTGTLLRPGDEVAAVVTAVKPFGVLVESRGVPGLVRGVSTAVGETVRVRVVEYDRAESRFHGTAV